MAGVTTRQSISAFKESIKDEDIVIIPADVFKNLMTSNVEQQEKMLDVTAKLCGTLESIDQHIRESRNDNKEFQATVCTSLEKLANNSNTILSTQPNTDEFSCLLEKLDNLTVAITSKNILAEKSQPITDDEFKSYANKRKDLVSKTIRAEQLWSQT